MNSRTNLLNALNNNPAYDNSQIINDLLYTDDLIETLDDNNLNTQYFEESQRSMSTKQIF
jgi:hypothetical protein